MKHPSQGSVYGLVLLVMLLGLMGGTRYGDEPLGARVLRHVVEEKGIYPDRLELEFLSPLRFPLTGLTLFRSHPAARCLSLCGALVGRS
jgi:hypothetical protein